MGDDVFDGMAGVVPGAIASGGVKGRTSGRGRRVDRPLSRDDVQMLASVPLFGGLSRRHLRRLAEHADIAAFRAGEAIVKQGQAGGTFYVLVGGEAEVVRGGRRIGTLTPGEFFGEISLLDGGPRTADVVAVTPVVAIRVFKQAFDRMLVEEPGVAARILTVVAGRLRESERSLSS